MNRDAGAQYCKYRLYEQHLKPIGRGSKKNLPSACKIVERTHHVPPKATKFISAVTKEILRIASREPAARSCSRETMTQSVLVSKQPDEVWLEAGK